MNLARTLWLWAPVVGFISLVWFLSDQGGPQLPVVLWDKLLHAGAYSLLGVLTLRACHGGLSRPWRPIPTTVGVLLALAYGALDEWHQSHVPGRDPSLADWLADAVGIGGAWVVLRATRLLQPREESSSPAMKARRES